MNARTATLTTRAAGLIGLSILAASADARAHDSAAADAIRDLQRSYRSQAICERIALQVRTPASATSPLPRVARASMVLRMEIEPRGLDDVPIVSLDMGTMVLTASNGQLLVTHPRDTTSYFSASYAGPLSPRSFAQIIQPVPIPELDLAGAAIIDDPCPEFWPYALNIQWKSVDNDGHMPGRRVVRGTCDGGTVSVTIAGNRLRSLTIERTEPRTIFLFTFTPTGPCEPQRAVLDVSRRTRVATLPDLRPHAGMLRVGAKLPEMQISPPAGGNFSVSDLLDPPPEAVIVGMSPADHAVLLLTRNVGQDGIIQSLPRLDLGRIADLFRQMRAASFEPRATPRPGDVEDPIARFGFARVLVMKDASPTDVLAQLKAAQTRWQDHLLMSTSPQTTIDAFAPGADACIAIIDAENILRAVWPVEPSQTAEQVADQVQAALFELAPTDTKNTPATIDTTKP